MVSYNFNKCKKATFLNVFFENDLKEIMVLTQRGLRRKVSQRINFSRKLICHSQKNREKKGGIKA